VQCFSNDTKCSKGHAQEQEINCLRAGHLGLVLWLGAAGDIDCRLFIGQQRSPPASSLHCPQPQLPPADGRVSARAVVIGIAVHALLPGCELAQLLVQAEAAAQAPDVALLLARGSMLATRWPSESAR
jgi:hypothetical protein